MNRQFIITPEAERDTLEAYRWYEDRQTGLGELFLQSLRRTYTRIQDFPLAAAIRKRKARRHAVKGFPYGVFYVVGDDYVSVISVHHDRRDPKHWKKRA